ncbi:MAG: Nif3-like dinuclear metal center hexameric protein [Leptospirales bacterium]|nr:Nif3-like dinuclear metal center hexameric protein [Leptospirales bacterium]
MKVNELIKKLKIKIPEDLQESYDNTGTQILFGDDIIEKIYICLDADMETVHDAKEKGCNLMITHHPLIFKPIKNISTDESRSNILLDLISSRISLYSLHTNFDKIMYMTLSDAIGFTGAAPLMNIQEIDGVEIGFGSFIELDKEMNLSELLSMTKERLNLEFITYCGKENNLIRSIAFMNGSGGGSIEKVIGAYNPDCIITGDVNYHNAKYAIDSGKNIIDAGHYGTEKIFKKNLAESLKEVLYDEKIELIISNIEENPFKVYK